MTDENKKSKLIQALENMPEESEVTLSLPGVAQLLGDASAGPWLIQTAETLATGSILQKTAALGLLARLWIPATREEQDRLTRNLIQGDTRTPVEVRCIEAFDLPEKSIDRVEQMACHKCAIVEEDLEALVKTVEENEPDATLAHNILLERDDLESIYFMLMQKKAGSALKDAMMILDYSLKSHGAYFDAARPMQCARLKEVSVFNPNAYWASDYLSAFVSEEQAVTHSKPDNVISIFKEWHRPPLQAAAATRSEALPTMSIESTTGGAWEARLTYNEKSRILEIIVLNAPDAATVYLLENKVTLEPHKRDKTMCAGKLPIVQSQLTDFSFALEWPDGRIDHGKAKDC